MATKTVAASSVILKNNWGGPHRVGWVPPEGFITPTAAAAYSLGMVASVFNHKTRNGWSDLAYLRLDSDGTYTAGLVNMICVLDGTAVKPTTVTNDKTRGAGAGYLSGKIAVAMAASITDDYYAWFWIGGAYPVDYCAISALVTTAAALTAGDALILVDAGEAGATYGEIGIGAKTAATIPNSCGETFAVSA